jgi:integrating conjugative element protein (TIGR03759 family)
MQSKAKTCLATVAAFLAVGSVASAQEGDTRRDTTITETRQTELSRSEIDRAKSWLLNESEWRRYRSLMQGIRGSVSPATLSPIEVLGIHARDAAERRQYAERWAIAMHEDAERILAFQRAYDDSARALYPGQSLIDTARLYGGMAQISELLPDDRILLRVSLKCPSCDAALASALKRLGDVAGIDIYVANVGESQQDAIRSWAKGQGIQSEWVRSRRVTLNIDRVDFGGQDSGEPLPTLYIRRGERLERLAYAAL